MKNVIGRVGRRITPGPAASSGDRPETSRSPMIAVENVTVELGDITALNAVNVTIGSGQFVGVVGPNGAGKTTLLRTITAAITPDTGRIRIRGQDVNSLSSRAVSQQVAVVPQETSLAFDFGVRDVVAMGRTPYRERLGGAAQGDANAVEEAMDRTDVRRFAERSITEVSGGERQRVLLARALAQQTPVLLLDEPTASLDINHQIRTLELVQELVTAGKTVLAAIHDLDLAARFCDELLLLHEGQRLAHGPPEDVLLPEHLETAFETAATVTTHPVTGAQQVTAFPADHPSQSGGRIHVVGGDATTARILSTLDRAGHEVSVGPLSRNAVAHEVATARGLETVTLPSFAAVDESARMNVDRLIDAADVTVLVEVEGSTDTEATRVAVPDCDSVIMIEDGQSGSGTPAGDGGRTPDEADAENVVVASQAELLETVAACIDAE